MKDLEALDPDMQQVTVDDMVDVIREAGQPVTAGDIAEAVGVTRQAIGKRRAELEQDDRIESGKVGQATAYWLAEWKERTKPELPASAPPPQTRGEGSSNDEGFLRRIFNFGTDEGMTMPGVIVLLAVFVGIPFFAGLVLRRAGKWVQEPFVSLLKQYFDDEGVSVKFMITFLTIFGLEIAALAMVAAFLGFPKVAFAGITTGLALGAVASYLFIGWVVWAVAAAMSWSISTRVIRSEVAT